MTGILLAQADTGGLFDVASKLADASPALMLAIFIIALLRRWLVLPRELDDRDRRIAELERERNEFKSMVFQALNVGERALGTVENGRDR